MKKRIVVSLLTDKQEFQRMQAEDARSAAARASIDVEVFFAEGSSAGQAQHLLGLIQGPEETRPAAIVVESVSAEGLERLARNAMQTGIIWVLLSTHAPYIEYLHQEYPAVPISVVTIDNEEIGRIQARQFEAILPKGGRILYVEGPGANAATIARRHVTTSALANSKVKIGKTVAGDWTESSAESAVSLWLRLKTTFRPDLVGCQNDSMAMGARKVILAQHPDWATIPITGCDGLPTEGQRLVKKGLLTATIVTPTFAGKGVELAASALRGESIPLSMLLPVGSYPSLEELRSGRR